MVLRKAQHVAGQDEACGAPGRREQRRDGRRRRRDRLLDERAKVALKRLKSDLDMRGGRRSDDDRVRLDLLDEAQGIGEALRERRARARPLKRGGVDVGYTTHDHVRPPGEPCKMFRAEGAGPGDEHA